MFVELFCISRNGHCTSLNIWDIGENILMVDLCRVVEE